MTSGSATPKEGADKVIASRFVPVALAYAEARGADTRALREAFSLGQGPLPDLVDLPLSRVASITDAIAELVEDRHLGLTLAATVPRGTGGVGELAARSAPTIGAALERIARYARIIPPRQEMTCTRTDDAIAISYYVPGAARPFAGRHTNEYAVAVIHRVVCELAGARPPVRRVWFAHVCAPPEIHARYEQLFGTADVGFDRDTDGIAFDLALAEEPVTSSDPAMLQVLEEYARSLLPTDPKNSTLQDVERVVGQLLVDGVPSLVTTARRLGVGERTLQRQLRTEGTTFAVLVEGIRRSLAERHLQRSSMSISEIAYLLGYSDGRAFARAFARWTGISPTTFRQRS